MPAEVRYQVGRALVREEEPRVLDLDDVRGAGDGVAQPIRPPRLEEGVSVAPHHERRDGQRAQRRFDREEIGRIEPGEEALEVLARSGVPITGSRNAPTISVLRNSGSS